MTDLRRRSTWRRRQQIEEAVAFYAPRVDPGVVVGARVLPLFATTVEGLGYGRVLAVEPDSVRVRWERTGSESLVDPSDVGPIAEAALDFTATQEED